MKLWHSFKKELKLASKSFYFYIELVMALVLLVVLLFVIPENFAASNTEYISIDLPEAQAQYIKSLILQEDLDNKSESVEIKSGKNKYQAELFEEEDKKIYLLQTEEEVIELAKDKRHIGAVITANEDGAFYKYYLQGYESERFKNALRIIHVKDTEVLEHKLNSQEVRPLQKQIITLSDRANAVPSLLVFNGSLMGFFIIAAYIFLDKQEGVIKAYAVTAASVWNYLLSKVGVILVTSIVSSLIVVIPVMGGQPNYLLLLIFLLSTGFFASSLGLLLASFYSNIMQSFGAMYTLMMVLIIPSISYFIASWEPVWVRFIPTYPMIQGFKEILSNGDASYVLITSLGFFVAGLLLFVAANNRYKKTLTV